MTLDADASRVAKAPPRQARALRTREKLIEAGRDAFGRFGVEGVNLADDILRPAGVSVGSFYHQFADKTELLLAVIGDGVDARHRLVLDDGPATADATIDEIVAEGFTRFFASLDNDRYAWRIQLTEQNNPDPRVHALVLQGRRRWVEGIAAALRRRTDARDDDVVGAATMLMGLATGTANVYLGLPDDERDAARAAMLDAVTRFAIAGLHGILRGDA